MGCHFSAKDAFPLSGAKLDFSLENKTNKMREERFHFKHLRYLNILRLLRSCLKFLRAVCMHTKSLRLCPTLCNPMDHSLLGSSVHGILQARILEWVAMPSFRGSFQPRDWTQVSRVAGGFFTVWTTRGATLWRQPSGYFPLSRENARLRPSL